MLRNVEKFNPFNCHILCVGYEMVLDCSECSTSHWKIHQKWPNVFESLLQNICNV